jgi:hypothetical protein
MNIRRIKNYIAIFALLGMVSCSESYLEDKPTTETLLENTPIRNSADLKSAVRGMYATMRDAQGLASDHMTFQELTADIGFVSSKNSGYFVGTNGGTHITPDGSSVGIWNSLYNTIAHANFVLSYEGKLEDDGSLASLFSHARSVRAFCFYTLLTYFSPNYGEGDQSLGVPYPTTYDPYAKLPRETVTKVVDNIIGDINLALANPPSSVSSNDMHNSFNSTALQLLLAKVYLFKKDYQNAIQYAQNVYNDTDSKLLSKTSNAADLLGIQKYFSVEGEPNPETLFQIQLDPLHNNDNSGLTGYWGSGSTYAQNFMARDFFDLFKSVSVAIDVRKSSWYAGTGKVAGTDYETDSPKPIDVRKYLETDRDIVVLRKTESVFIIAEAQYHSDPSKAKTTMENWMKTYRYATYKFPNVTGEAVLDEILLQKGLEFFLEGHRFVDLKRNHKPIVKYQKSLNLTIPADDRRFIWPVPLNEMQTNPNMKQAPGY